MSENLIAVQSTIRAHNSVGSDPVVTKVVCVMFAQLGLVLTWVSVDPALSFIYPLGDEQPVTEA